MVFSEYASLQMITLQLIQALTTRAFNDLRFLDRILYEVAHVVAK